MSNYHTRAAVPLDSPAYVPRSFERLTEQNVSAGRWVLILGPHQHGKTTGLIRVKSHLQEAAYYCAKVDLQSQPLCEDFEEFLSWFATEISTSLGVSISTPPAGYSRKSAATWIETALPSDSRPVVLLIDEAAAITNCEWLQSFYGQLRSIANKRAESVTGDLARRLSIVFSGAFLPEYLMPDSQNSPFNVCETIQTEDLTLEGLHSLQQQIEGYCDQDLVSQLYDSIGGQPYLAQMALYGLRDVQPNQKSAALTSLLCSYLTGTDEHFISLYRRVDERSGLREIVASMLSDDGVFIDPGSHEHRYLQIVGLAKAEGPRLVFRNAVYQQIARARYRDWVVKATTSGTSSNAVDHSRTGDVQNEIRILFLASNPRDSDSLRIDAEVREIDSALQKAEFGKRFQFRTQLAVRVADLQDHLLRYRPHIVHFSGHGSTGSEIILEDEFGNSHAVPPEFLSRLFMLLGSNIRCVILNACYSESQARAIADHIDCVVGMSRKISDDAAIKFSVAFYRALAYGESVKTAFGLGQVQIGLERLPGDDVSVLIASSTNAGEVKFIEVD